MKECVLCKQNDTEEDYSYDDYLNEIHTEGNKCYCRECKERIRIKRRRDEFYKAIKKVGIKESAYSLPGFKLSEDGTHWVKPDKKEEE